MAMNEGFRFQTSNGVLPPQDLHQPYSITGQTFGYSNAHLLHGYAPAGSHHTPRPSTSSSESPAPCARLAGEPAFCAGRHCCQWQTNGFACNNHYPSAEDLDKHVAADHAGRYPDRSPSGDYHCHWAGCSKTESFGNKPKLTRHIHSHTGHKPHACKFPGCEKGFVTKEQLKNHETTHTRTREHVCPECGKGFAVKTALASHMNVHKGAKPYVCDECGKGFADSSNLSKHKAIHKRAALKKGHHARRTSCASTTTSTSASMMTTPVMASAQPYTHPYPHPHLPPTWPTPSIENFSSEYCPGRPCFDEECPDRDKIPCRSVSPCKSAPCSNRACTLEPCPVPDPCNAQDCVQEGCELPHCPVLPDCDWQDCDFQHCGLDCGLEGCTRLCGEDLGCFCDEEQSISTPSTKTSVTALPAQAAQATAMDPRLHCQHGHPHPPDDPYCGLREGFKHLEDFIHGDFCGCGTGNGARLS